MGESKILNHNGQPIVDTRPYRPPGVESPTMVGPKERKMLWEQCCNALAQLQQLAQHPRATPQAVAGVALGAVSGLAGTMLGVVEDLDAKIGDLEARLAKLEGVTTGPVVPADTN